MTATPSPSDAALLRAYAATRWAVDLPEGPVVVQPGRPAPAALRSAAIVTAYNPASRRVGATRNTRADDALRIRLSRAGLVFHRTRAVPWDPADTGWIEPGFAVLGCERDDAVALGARYGQNAIVWIDGYGRVSLAVTRRGFCGLDVGAELPPPDTNEEC